MPAIAPLAFTVILIDAAEFHTLVEDVLGRTVGFVVFGDAQETAKMNADKSLDTLGIDAPTTPTLWPEEAAIVLGLRDVIEASTGNVRTQERMKNKKNTDETNSDSQSA